MLAQSEAQGQRAPPSQSGVARPASAVAGSGEAARITDAHNGNVEFAVREVLDAALAPWTSFRAMTDKVAHKVRSHNLTQMRRGWRRASKPQGQSFRGYSVSATVEFVEAQRVARFPGDEMVGARGVAADARGADPDATARVERETAAEYVHSAGALFASSAVFRKFVSLHRGVNMSVKPNIATGLTRNCRSPRRYQEAGRGGRRNPVAEEVQKEAEWLVK